MRILLTVFFTVCLSFGYISCQSMLQNKGEVYYVYQTKQNQTNNSDFINLNAIDSIWRKLYNSFTPKGRNSESSNTNQNPTGQTNNEEVIKLENLLTELTTAVTSAIAGIYCLVKVILNIVNKVKKWEYSKKKN